MASQPTRSALLLTTIALLGLCVCVVSANDLKANGVPKFGDRISPRHRPFVELDSQVASSSSRNRNSEPSSALKFNKNFNNLNLNNNYSISLSNSAIRGNPAVLSADANTNGNYDSQYVSAKTNSNKESDRLLVTRGSEKTAASRTANDDDDDEDAINILGLSRKSDDHDRDADKSRSGRSNDDNVLAAMNDVELPVVSDNLLPPSINGNTSSVLAQAHRLEMSTEFFVVPSTASSMTRSTTIRPGGVVLAARPPAAAQQPSDASVLSNRPSIVTPPTIVSTHHGASGLRREPWVVPVLVLASLAMIMMAAFEIFVLCKAWRTSPSRRHLFLGQMLLLGLFSCAGLAAVLTATPTLLSCATVRFGAGVAYALVFASLLVKCVFLISLNGGVYLPAPYQGLLLLFAVLIQVAVGAQWLLTSPPAVDNFPVAARSGTSVLIGRHPLLLTAHDITTTVPLCKTPFPELLFSLVYVVFLILFVAVLAIKSRGIRDNYREATYIGLAIGGSIPIWLGWTLCGLAVADRHKDACLAFGLVATSATVFLVMFMPKGRQLAAMGKEGLYVEDREEQFSSLSRAGSGYSPSFFHFKPIKYGVMGPAPTSNTNTGNGTSSKHQAVATLGGGKYLNICLLFLIA